MADELFTISFDVSQALAAQNKIIDKFDDISKAGKVIVTDMEPLKEQFNRITDSAKKTSSAIGSISSKTRLSNQIVEIEKIVSKLKEMQKLSNLTSSPIYDLAVKSFISSLKEANSQIIATTRFTNNLASQIKAIPAFKFDVSSVKDYQTAIDGLKNNLSLLYAAKPQMNAVDFTNFEKQYRNGITKYEQALESLIGVNNTKITTIQKDWDLTSQRIQSSFTSGMMSGMAKYEKNVADMQGYTSDKLTTVQKDWDLTSQRMQSNFVSGMAAGMAKYEKDLAALKDATTSNLTTVQKNWDLTSQRMQKSFMSGMTSGMSRYQSTGSIINTAKVDEATKKLSGLGLVIKRVFEYGIVYRFQNALLSIPGTIYDMNSAMERLRATYTGAFGDSATAMLNYAKDAANRYGKSIDSIGDSYRSFSITMNELGISSKTTNNIFESFTEALTKSGASSDDTKNAFRALIQMYSKGTVSAEEFTRQLSQYIPAANSLAAKSLGVATAEFKKLLTTGQLVPNDFIPQLAQQLKLFGMGWEESADTMEANVKRMKNALMELTDSKSFQSTFSEITQWVTAGIKDLANVVSGTKLAFKGDINFLTWLFGTPQDLDNAIKEYESKIATLDDKISYLKDKYKKETSAANVDDTGDTTLDTVAMLKNSGLTTTALELNAAQTDKWAQQVKDALKDVASDYTTLQRKLKSGDLTVQSDIEYDKAKMTWLVDILEKIKGFDGKRFLASLDVDSSGADAALVKLDKLYKKTKEYKVASAENDLKDAEALVKRLESGVYATDAVSGSGAVKGSVSPIKSQEEATVKLAEARAALTKANKDYVTSMAGVIKADNASLSDNVRMTKTNSGMTKADQIASATQDWMDKWNAAVIQYQTSNGRYTSENFQKDIEYNNKVISGQIALINKQGQGSANAAARHANAVEKAENSIDNLLTKEFALANQDPLSAAFAAADEKANSLMKTINDLAIKGGVDVETAKNKVAEYLKLAKQVAVNNQIESVLPWEKKDNNITSVEKILKDGEKAVAEYAQKHGEAFDSVKKNLENYVTDAKAAYEVAKKLGSANSFGEYAQSLSLEEDTNNSARGSNTKNTWKELYEYYTTITKGMGESRVAMYKRVAEEAKAYGYDEQKVQAFIQEKWEEAELAKLQALQKYGDASEAFSSRLSENLGLYKSAATKAREEAVSMADSVSDLLNGITDGTSQSIGDLIRGLSDGTASIEDLWKNMLTRMLDSFASFVEKIVKNSLSDAFTNLFGKTESEVSKGVSASGLFGGSSNSQNDSDLLGVDIGTATGKSFGEYIKKQGNSGFQFAAGSTNTWSDAMTEGIDNSKLSTVSNAQYSDTVGSGTANGASNLSWDKILGNATIAGTGVLGLISSASSGNVGGLVGSGLTTAGGILGTLGAAGTGLLGMSAATTGGVGAVIAIAGMLASAIFGGTSSSTTKTASQYRLTTDPRDSFVVTGNTADRYKTTTSGLFGSSTSTHTVWGDLPRDIGKEVQEALTDSFSTLKDYAQTYGFSTDKALSYNFTGITIDQGQVDAFKTNMENVYTYTSLATSGLVGAVNMIQAPYETYSETLKRLSSATDTVTSSTEAFGYNLSDMAGITQESIDAMRGYNVSFASTYKPTWDLMASQMDGFVDVLNNLNWYYDTTNDNVSAANSVTDEQLIKLLEAEYASQIIDAVGGDDAYTKIMANVVSNTMSTMQAYGNEVTYYTNKANESIQGLSNSAGVTVENFWSKFSEAMKSGLSVDDFKAWSDASNIVNTLNDVTDALDELEATAANFKSSLDARYYTALGDDKNAIIAQHTADAEYELYQARVAGYDENVLLYLQQVQQMELDKQLSDLYDDLTSAAQSAARSLEAANADLSSREYKAAGDTPMSKWVSLIQSQLEELQTAYDNGRGQEFIDRLEAVQASERSSSWKEWQIDELQSTLNDMNDSLDDIVSELSSAMDSISTIVDTQLSSANSFSSTASSLIDTLSSTILSITTSDVSPLTSAEKASSLGSQIDTAYATLMSADHGQASLDAAQTISDLASSYLEAAKSSMSYTDYLAVYSSTMQKLSTAKDVTGSEYNYYERIANALEVEQNIFQMMLKELQKDSPDSAKISALLASSQSMSSSLTGIYADTVDQGSWRNSVEVLLKNAGYSDADITAALGGPTSTSSFLAQLNAFNTTTMPTYINSILALLNDIKNVAGQINSESPTVPEPTTDPGNTASQSALASNVRSAMNAQYYGGRSDWTVDEVLANLSTYSSWASAYGVSSTQGYTTPSDVATSAYYNETAWSNQVSGGTKTWSQVQALATAGGENYITDWLNYGYRYWSFPTTDQTLYKTVQMVVQAFGRDSDLANYAGTPYGAAKRIASRLGTTWGFDGNNSASSLETIARNYYQQYGQALGVVQPYALGGTLGNNIGLVGEIGPELISGPGVSVTKSSVTREILGQSFSDLTEVVEDLVSIVKRQGEALAAMTTYNMETRDLLRRITFVGVTVKTDSKNPLAVENA